MKLNSPLKKFFKLSENISNVMEKFTKIIATIGPASDSKDKIKKLNKKGVDVFRLNFSHGDYQYFDKVIKSIREVNQEIPILLDTKGPEIRTGDLDNELSLDDGQNIYLTSKNEKSEKDKITINYPSLSKVGKGSKIMLDDGQIEVEVVENNEEGDLKGRVISGGSLGSKKTVSIRGHDINLDFLTDKDKEDIIFGLQKGIDFIAASFVRTGDDIDKLREFVKHYNENTKIISKIEHPKAVENIDCIIEKSDGVMVARGDLGVELPIEKVPAIQDDIISKCNLKSKPVIVATQMLESMKSSKLPTRAEVADVANAIMQGTDAVMLSAETAIGKYPQEAVSVMKNIAKEHEFKASSAVEKYDKMISHNKDKRDPISSFISKSAYMSSKELNLKAIFTITESGFSARMISRFKPNTKIYAVTRDQTVNRQLDLSWGVSCILLEKEFTSHEQIIDHLVNEKYKNKELSKEDIIAFTAGDKVLESGFTHSLEIYKVEWIIERIESKKK